LYKYASGSSPYAIAIAFALAVWQNQAAIATANDLIMQNRVPFFAGNKKRQSENVPMNQGFDPHYNIYDLFLIKLWYNAKNCHLATKINFILILRETIMRKGEG